MKMWIRSLDFIMVKIVAAFLCRIGRFSNNRSPRQYNHHSLFGGYFGQVESAIGNFINLLIIFGCFRPKINT